jgi:hypothetical protein
LTLAALLTTVALGAVSPAFAQESGERPPERQEGAEEIPEPPPQEPVFDPVASQLTPGMPDELVTVGGSRLIGEVKELKAAQVKLKTTSTGNIFVKWELVRTLRTSRFFEVVLDSGVKFYGLIVGTEDGRLFVGVGESFAEVDRQAVVEITRIRQSFWERFKGDFDIGLGLSKASRQRELTSNLNSRFRNERAEWRLSGSVYVREQEGSDRVNRNSASLIYNRFLASNWFVAFGVQAEHNSELGLEVRALAFGGAGYHLVRDIRNDLQVYAGIAPSREGFLTDEPSQSNLESLLGTRYTRYVLGSTDTRIELNVMGFGSFTTGGRYRYVGNVALRHEITSDLYFSINGYGAYDTKPPSENSPNNDYSVSIGAGVSW